MSILAMAARIGRLVQSHIRFQGFLASVSQNSALRAALALVGIQVGIGLIMKTSQKDGKYAFSPSSSVTISEGLKFLLSTWLFWQECRTRVTHQDAPQRNTEVEFESESKADAEAKPFLDDPESNGGKSSNNNNDYVETFIGTRLQVQTFWQYVKHEVSLDVRYGFVRLALFYVLINNLIFVSYKLADPGTISLAKSGVTLITALVMIVALGTRIGKIQWSAISLQVSSNLNEYAL